MFRFDNRILYIILGIFVITGVIERISNPDSMLMLVLSLPAVLIAITFHEYAHAWAADKLGDETPRSQGRLSLNPIAHLDPVGTVLLIFAGFGWGKPVQVNPRNYITKMSTSKADALVSFAGPAMNFVLAIIFMIIYYAVTKFAPAFKLTDMGYIIIALLQAIVIINLGLGIFNLIPLPPLDGSKILNHFLSYDARQWFAEHEYYFYIAFLLLWLTGLAGMIISPLINGIYTGLSYAVGWIFSLF